MKKLIIPLTLFFVALVIYTFSPEKVIDTNSGQDTKSVREVHVDPKQKETVQIDKVSTLSAKQTTVPQAKAVKKVEKITSNKNKQTFQEIRNEIENENRRCEQAVAGIKSQFDFQNLEITDYELEKFLNGFNYQQYQVKSLEKFFKAENSDYDFDKGQFMAEYEPCSKQIPNFLLTHFYQHMSKIQSKKLKDQLKQIYIETVRMDIEQATTLNDIGTIILKLDLIKDKDLKIVSKVKKEFEEAQTSILKKLQPHLKSPEDLERIIEEKPGFALELSKTQYKLTNKLKDDLKNINI